MAVTTPYQQNDYQSQSTFRPYNLPVNDIFKALQAQDEFWKEGARRVKSVYDNALGMELTLDANKEFRDEYMKEAEKKLTKLSAMDLSSMDVQREGMNIFKPLLQDESVLLDNHLTKHKGKIQADAMSYRTKKLSATGVEGEGFNQKNLAYAMDGFEQFHAGLGRDPAALKDLYGKLGKKAYTPYYEPSKEYATILKNCKGSGGEKQDVASNYLYFDNTSKTGANSNETTNCFQQGLSGAAKEQIGINGWAHYKNNPEALIADHQEYALGSQKKQLDAVQGQIAALRSAKTLTAEQKETLKRLEEGVGPLDQQYKDRVKEFNELTGGNAADYVAKNFDLISRGVYTNKMFTALGEAYKSDETNRKVTSNASGIVQYNDLARARSEHRQHIYRSAENTVKNQHAINLENLRSQNDLTNGLALAKAKGEVASDTGTMVTPVTPAGADLGREYGENDFMQEHETAFNQYSNAYQTIASYIKTKYPKEAHGHKMTNEFILNFVETQSKLPKEQRDSQFNDLMQVYNSTKEEYTNKDLRRQAITEAAEQAVPQDPANQALLAKKYKLSDGTTFTGSDAFAIERDENGGVTIKGRRIKPSSGDQRDIDDLEVIRQAQGSVANIPKAFQDAKNNLYKKAYYDGQNYMTPRVDVEKNKVLGQAIQAQLGVSGGANAKNGFQLFGHDKRGEDMYVSPIDAEGAVQTDKDKVQEQYDKVYLTNPNAKMVNLGGKYYISLPKLLPPVPGVATDSQIKIMDSLKDFGAIMATKLQGHYASSEDLKNADGTAYAYNSHTFTVPNGPVVKVSAIKANGRIQYKPAIQNQDGTWMENTRLFDSTEELVTFFSK